MTTKDASLFLKDKPQSLFVNHNSGVNHDQQKFYNLNLNQTQHNLKNSSVQSFSKQNSDKQFATAKLKDSKTNYMNYNGKSKFLNNETTSITALYFNALINKDIGKHEKKNNNASIVKNSTLSLHIAAYENSVEAIGANSTFEETKNLQMKEEKRLQKWTKGKQFFTDSTASLQILYEFPRQQKASKNNNPEVMQFKTSQKLLNLNESSIQPSSLASCQPSSLAVPSTKLEEPSETNIPTTDAEYTTSADSVDYTIVRGRSNRMYRVYNIIGKGGYGVVHRAAYEMKNGQFLLVAIKSECTESLDVEVRVLLRLKDGTHFCTVFDEGFDPFSQTKFMVMTLVGENLSSLRRQFGRFSWGTVLRIGIQTLHAIEELHARGFLSRDVKPSNFAVGHAMALRRMVYMLDFGIARTYVDDSGNPLPKRQGTSFRGTSRYCALRQHREPDQCRRDDVESWFYLLVELTAGKLPWAGFSRHEKDKIADSKQNARTFFGRRQFLSRCPSQYKLIMDAIDRWQFETMPDYDGLYVLVTKVLNYIGVKYDDMYDWETLDKYKQTATSSPTYDEKLKLFDHCIFVSHAELQKLVENAPLPNND